MDNACIHIRGSYRIQSFRVGGGGGRTESLHDSTGACAHPNKEGLGHSEIDFEAGKLIC